MDNDKLVKKILNCIEKGKVSKVNRILIKNKSNSELFDKLLKETTFTEFFLVSQLDSDVFQKLDINVQKNLIYNKTRLFTFASDEIRDDINFINDLMEAIEKKQTNDNIELVYHFLGPNLSRNKEYIDSIKDKYPIAFIKSINKIDFTEQELKNFFDKYPEYVKELPPSLKTDYNYVASLISKIPSNYIEYYLNEFDYDLLNIDIIKNAIIDNAGLKKYQMILLYSIVSDNSKLDKISPQELQKMILIDPGAFGDAGKFNSLLSFGNQKENYKLINKINNISCLMYKNINTPQKFSQQLFELSNAINNGLTYDQILKEVTKNWEQIVPWIMQLDEEHLLANGKFDNTLPKYEVFTKIYNILIGIEENKLEDIFNIFINSELRKSEYGEGIRNINVTEENIEFLRLICNTRIFSYDNNSIEMLNKLFLRFSSINNNPYMAVGVISNLVNDKNLCILLKNVDVNKLDDKIIYNLYNYIQSELNSLVKIEKLEELKNFNLLIEKLEYSNLTDKLHDKKYKLIMDHFGISLATAEDLLHSYFSSSENFSLYQKYPDIMYLRQLLEKVVLIGNEKEFYEVESVLNENNVKITFDYIQERINKIKKEYAEEINNSLLKTDVSRGILDYSEKDFNLLVHVIGAYGSSPQGDVYDSWNTKEGTSNISICSSFISENNMGIAPTNEHSVILGFSNLPSDYLELMSCNDLFSDGFKAKRKSKFLTPNELKNNTRHGHNEIVMKRRKGQFTEDKVEPSYIVCFDKINEESKKASEKFGIPIIYIDREKVALNQRQKINDMVNLFYNTLDYSIISKIISEQENNRAGLKLNRPDLVEKYFNLEYRQKNINTIYSIIQNELRQNNPKAIAAMQEFVRSIEVEKDKFKIDKEIKQRENVFDLNVDEFIRIFKNNSKFNDNVSNIFVDNLEEIYEKFIRCREKLSEQEKQELKYLNNFKNNENQNYNSLKG